MIHPLAHVAEDVTLGDGTRVWQFASVIRRARIGADSVVGACSVVDGSRLGDRAHIGHGAQVHPGVVAGSDLFVGPGAVICNDRWPWLGGEDFDIDALIEGRALTVICGDNVTIGAGAIILPGTRLESGCVIAAGAVAEYGVEPDHILRRDGSMGLLKKRNLGGRMHLVA